MRPLRFAAIPLLAGLAAVPAHGQGLLDVGPGLRPAETPAEAPRFSLTLGVLGTVAPVYDGSDSYRFAAFPAIDLRYRDIAFASARDGLGLNLIRADWITAGPVVRYRFGRDADENRALRGLGDVGGTVEVGVLANIGTGPLRLRLEAAQGVNGDGHRGLQARADLTYAQPLGRRMLVSFGPSVSYGDSQFNQTYFGITRDQAARSGYAEYRPGAGIRDVGFGGSAVYRLGGGFALTAVAEVRRLLWDVADSPIVRDETQGFLGLGVSWRGAL